MTVARWQRVAAAVQALLLALWLAWCARQGWAALAAAVVAMPLLLRLPLAPQFLLAARHGGPAGPGATAWLRAWWGEGPWSARVFGWWQPFRAGAVADALPPPGAARGRGVVLVHGFGCNRGFWTPWLRRLGREGRAFVAVNLEPPLASIDDHAPALDAAVRRVLAATGQPPLVVAHSMGGLVVRAWMRAAPDAEALVHRVVTIGTPHHGTEAAARFAVGACGRQMAPGSRWLRELAASEPAGRFSRFDCWQSDCDNVVYPEGTALLEGAGAHTVRGVGHVQLGFEAEVVEACLGYLG